MNHDHHVILDGSYDSDTYIFRCTECDAKTSVERSAIMACPSRESYIAMVEQPLIATFGPSIVDQDEDMLGEMAQAAWLRTDALQAQAVWAERNRQRLERVASGEWSQMNAAEERDWYAAHSWQKLEILTKQEMKAAKDLTYPRFAARYQRGHIQSSNDPQSRDILVDGQHWIAFADLLNIREISELRVPTPAGTGDGTWEGVQHLAEVARKTADQRDIDAASDLVTAMMTCLDALGYKRVDLMKAWDATHP